jgi:hypothetical protein
MVPRPLAVPVLALAFAVTGCKKPAEIAAADGGTTGAAATGASATSGAPSFGSDFEGTLTLHVTHPPAPATDMTFSTKDGSLRIDMPVQGGQATHSLFDSKARTVTIIMDSQKLAMTTPLAKAAPQGSPGTASVTKTGKHESVAGYDCEDWDIVSARGTHTQACIARGVPFFDFAGMAGPRDTGSWADALRDTNGFPLRAVDLDAAGKETSRVEVTQIEKKPLLASLFHVPAGFDSVVAGRAAGLHGPNSIPGQGLGGVAGQVPQVPQAPQAPQAPVPAPSARPSPR